MGSILEKAVRQSGYPISKLAVRIGYTRQHIYNLFNQQHIDYALLEKIGKTIHYNFADELKHLKGYEILKTEFDTSVNKNTEIVGFKEKYYKLLEEHNALLLENAALMKNCFKVVKLFV